MQTLSKTMQRLLEEKGWSKQTLCKRAGLHYQQVYKVLSGQTQDPRLSTLIRLAKAFDLPLGFLQDVEEPQYELREDGKKRKKPKRTQAKEANEQ
jgi:transcriptional regulator with XRE-family HTH domain